MKSRPIAVIWSLFLTLALASACVGPAGVAPGPIATATPQVPAQATTPVTPNPTAAAAQQAPAKATRQAAPTPTSKPKGKTPAPPPAPSDPKISAGPLLGRPTASSVTANVVTAMPMEVYYEFGTAPGAYTGRTAAQAAVAGAPIETLIAGLQPNTRYYYRLRYGSAAGEERSFVTQRAPGSTFSFAIQGDSHPERDGRQFDADLYVRTLLTAAAGQPDFFVAMGDDFSVDTLKTVNAQAVRSIYLAQRHWLGLVDAPLFLVNGNHEQASLANLDGTPNNVAVWAQISRNAYYPQPAPDSTYTGNARPVEHIGLLRNYYAFNWGDALFMVIDPYWHSPQTVDNQFGVDRDDKRQRDLWNVTLGEEQYQWFKSTLESSSAKYKFVFAHHVNGTGRGGVEVARSYEWGDASRLAAHRPGWTKTIHQIMAENHVSIFFQGHDHIFVRQELDNVVYLTLPEPANPFYTLENADAFLSGDKLPNSGYVEVTVAPDGATVDYVRTYLPKDETAGAKSGDVAYSFTVLPGPGR